MALMLRVRLFGAFEVRAGGAPVTLTSSRAQSLLAYLTLRGGPQRRERVAGALWPGSTDRQARTNLRHVLHTLRGCLPDAERHLVAAGETLVLRDVTADVEAFDAALDGGADTVNSLRAAADLYAGDLLDGWYDDWLAADRDAYRQRATAVLARLVSLLEEAGDLDSALRYADRARALDPLAEGPYRALMRLHDARGDRARAVRVYHECVATLGEELGVPPSPETRAGYEALLPSAGPAPRPGAVTAFVGRHLERRRLTGLWRAASAGEPHLVLVAGEPGVGKSRLVEEFRQWAAHGGAVCASARSYAAEGSLAYAPVVAWLRELGVPRWRSRLAPAHLSALAPLVPELGMEPAPPEPGSRLLLFDALARALHAGDRPLLLVADDLHAADAATLQFLHYLLRADPRAPLLVAATARLAETDAGHPLHALLAALRALGRCTPLTLGRFDRAETAVLARRLGHDLSDVEAGRLHEETDGNALFVVEALRGGDPLTVPPRVQAVLEARLSQLTAGARKLAGVAAAAGPSVPGDVLGRVHPSADDLDELWRREILVTAGRGAYAFSHDKLREVAYGLLSPAQRRHHHARLARALQEAYADDTAPVAGQIAAHLHQAGTDDEAVGWYARAAVTARRRYADTDAADLLHKAWAILRDGPATPRRLRRELEVLTALPAPLSAAEGYASPRLRVVLDRAFELAERLGADPAAPLVRARAMAVLARGDFDAALRYGAQLRDRDAGDDVLAVEGAFVQGVAAAWRNEAAAAQGHLSAAVARYRPENRAAHLLAYGPDPLVLCLARLAHVHLCLGEPAEARRLREESLVAARAAGHPFTLAAALLFAALVDLDLDDVPALRDRVRELAGLGPRVEAAPIRLFTEAMAGCLDVLDGAVRPGLARIDAALADPARETNPGVPAMLLRIRLAAVLAAGLRDEAGDTARRLLADGVRVWDALATAVLAGER